MIDLNQIVNMEILKSRMAGMNDLASELIEISKKGDNVSDWSENGRKILERCYKTKEEYQKFLREVESGGF